MKKKSKAKCDAKAMKKHESKEKKYIGKLSQMHKKKK